MKWTVPAIAALALLPACQLFQGTQPVAPAPVAETAAAPAAVPGEPMFPELVSFTPGNLPGSDCASDSVIEADQFIRLHTYLMVAGLSCQGALSKPNMFVDYSAFTSDHQDRIRDAQSVLGQFLSSQLRGNSARLFDTYRTEMANDESKVVTDVSTGRYCQARNEQFTRALAFSDSEMQAYLDEAVERYRASYNACNPAPTPAETPEAIDVAAPAAAEPTSEPATDS